MDQSKLFGTIIFGTMTFGTVGETNILGTGTNDRTEVKMLYDDGTQVLYDDGTELIY